MCFLVHPDVISFTAGAGRRAHLSKAPAFSGFFWKKPSCSGVLLCQLMQVVAKACWRLHVRMLANSRAVARNQSSSRYRGPQQTTQLRP